MTTDILPNFPAEMEKAVLDAAASADKPFNECLTCRYFRDGCSGPNLLEMDTERMWEFLEIVRKRLGWSYGKVADLTGIAVANVKKNLTNQIKSPELPTVRLISRALVGDPSGKYPCALGRATAPQVESDKVQELLNENAELRRELVDLRFRHDWIVRDWEFKRESLESQTKMIKKLMDID